MEYSLRISIRAEDDTANAIDYYDKINPVLGNRFLVELYEIYDKLVANPQLYSLVSSNPKDKFRDVKLRSFPYVVIYEIDQSRIYVTAVMNTNRKPFIL